MSAGSKLLPARISNLLTPLSSTWCCSTGRSPNPRARNARVALRWDRAAWGKPTVLLGSAGLNLAVIWKVRGGSG
jgi:hypothetical protein